MKQIYKQVLLIHDNRHLTCWLPVDGRVKVGVRLTLKGMPEIWKVVAIYTIIIDAPPDMSWNNNI